MSSSVSKQRHGSAPFLLATSRVFERSAYWGFRSIILLYLISEVNNFDEEIAGNFYATLSLAILGSRLLGAILADFLLGNKLAMIIGNISQALGSFILIASTNFSVYAGVFLIVLGTGLYTPSLISRYGKLYLKKNKIVDAGFSILTVFVNIASFFGVGLIIYFGEMEWAYGFAAAGTLFLISIIPPLLLDYPKEYPSKAKYDLSADNRAVLISIVLLLIGLFWGLYEFFAPKNFEIQGLLAETALERSLFSGMSSFFVMAFAIIAAVVWSFVFYNQYFKLAIGFILGGLGYFILTNASLVADDPMFVFIGFTILLGIAEVHLQPVVYSMITQLSNPKYLTLFIALSFIPTTLFHYVNLLIQPAAAEFGSLTYTLGWVAMVLIGIGVLLFAFKVKGRVNVKGEGY